MKVLEVSASPRKGGNSDVLCDRLLKGASENGNEVEKIKNKDFCYIIAAADPEHSAADANRSLPAMPPLT